MMKFITGVTGTSLLVLFALLINGCTRDEHEQNTQFTKLSSGDTGITFVNANKEDDTDNVIMYEYFYNGGGVAIGDVNNDGLADIYFTSNRGDNKLYLNKGDLKFEDITESAGVTCRNGWKTGVSLVDINADGYLDIYVCRSKEDHPLKRENLLYINNHNLTFTEKARQYNLNDDSYSTQASFLDFDHDGDLDVFLLNHSLLNISNSYDVSLRKTTERTPYVGNKLYRNDGEKFHDVSDSLGIYGPPSNYGLGMAYADINNDGWLDVYTSNDYTGPDKLYISNGRRFNDVTDSMLSQISQFSMGVDIADINNDGNDDIISVDMLPEDNKRQKELFWPDRYDVHAAMVKNGLHYQYMRNMLHLNNGNGTFSEIGQLAGISNTDWSWAPLFADYDNDGYQDLFVSNGYKRDFTNNEFLRYKADLLLKIKQGKTIDKIGDVLNKMPSNKLRSYFFKNTNGISFDNVSASWGIDEKSLTNGAAYADLDNDGDLDLVMNRMDEEAGVYRNNAEKNGNHFLRIKLVGTDKNTAALGGIVIIYSGGKLMKRTLCPYRGFQSAVEPFLSFGLGTKTTIDSLVVQWPRGESQILKNVKCDQMLTLKQSDGAQIQRERVPNSALFEERKDLVSYIHRENDFIDFKKQTLLPRAFSRNGPAMAVGDVNKDGLQDIFLGGAKGSPSQLFVQQGNGKYQNANFKDITLEREAVDAIFFDKENDGDLDLYVVTGGYEFEVNDPLLKDHLYENDGHGNFKDVALPDLYISGSCVRAGDINNDGYLDLFVGGRVVPGRYPEVPQSSILMNDGKGHFTEETKDVAASLSNIGMVTDAAWVDINADRINDLIVVGEWMPIKIFINSKGTLKDESEKYLPHNTEGWWNCIALQDLDQDGRTDLIVGNYGNNNQFRPTESRPVSVYYDDFDNNGSVDPIMNYFIGDQSFPSPTRDELVDQVPSFKKKFTHYSRYATSTIDTILTKEQLGNSKRLSAYHFESAVFMNTSKGFIMKSLPIEAQFAPIYAIQTFDVNNDGRSDLVVGGNHSMMGARFGKASGSFCTVLLNSGKGDFKTVPPSESGLCVRADIRKMAVVNSELVIAANSGSLKIFSSRPEAKQLASNHK